MVVKVFEDLEVWKEGRRLTQRIYQLTKNENFSKDFALRVRSGGPLCRSCRTLPKGSSVVAIRSSFNFFMLRHHVAK